MYSIKTKIKEGDSILSTVDLRTCTYTMYDVISTAQNIKGLLECIPMKSGNTKGFYGIL